ncbi:MAG TPA: SDR family oxidoreductase [Syntrophaceae bacterium]|nr:SDR family oxidoreductase [Syntrophaceae bacterium]
MFLVTGGAGFIGSNIVEELLRRGEKVRVLDNFSNGKKENLSFILNPRPTHQIYFDLIEGDIRNISTCHKACKGVDYVLHQAALGSVPRSIDDPVTTNEVNITGTLNMLIAARDAKVKRFIYASSSSIYGGIASNHVNPMDPKGHVNSINSANPITPLTEAMPPNPKSPYAVTKLVGEHYCKVFYSIYGLETISLRYFNIFGPRQDPNSQYAAVIPKFVKALLNGQMATIYGDGEQTRDFTYVANVVQANIKASYASKEALGMAFNIACGQNASINQLYRELVRLLNLDSLNLTPIYAASRPGDVRHSLADISRARSLLGYEPKINFRDGLAKTVEWFKSNMMHDA